MGILATDLRPKLNVAQKFKEATEKLAYLAGKNGYSVRPYTDPSLPIFSRLPIEAQIKKYSDFKPYVQVCEEIDKQGHSLCDSPFLLRKILKRLGLSAEPEVFDFIADEDIVELYTAENVQLFRNMNFFGICSYSLEELLCEPWWTLYWREDEVTRDIFLHASRIFSGEYSSTVSPGIGRHLLKEKGSHLKFQMWLDIRYFSPVRGDGQTNLTLAIERAEATHSLVKKSYLNAYLDPQKNDEL